MRVRNCGTSNVYIIHPNWVSIGLKEYAFKDSYLDLLFLSRWMVCNDVKRNIWTTRDSWNVIRKPATKIVTPISVNIRCPLSWLKQARFITIPKNIKLAQHICRATEPKNIPEYSCIIFDKTWNDWYSWDVICTPAEKM